MKKIICSALSALLLLTLVLPCFAASTAPVSQDVPVRDIAIVFDNSGTMYEETGSHNPVNAWCRATYATEIFAAMLNQGDTLKVFPMNPITTDGSTEGGSTDPITVTSTADISKIHNMYAVDGREGDTPIETITDAYNSLLGSTADEKWLVVLTDGTQFYEDGVELSEAATKERLTQVLTEYSQNVNVQYLGIGTTAGAVPDTGDSQNFTVTLANSSDAVTEKLSEVCNNIFGRDALPAQYINGNSLNFDVSMSKLIVLVQGNDASITDLKDSSGNTVSEIADSRYGVTYSPSGSPQGEPDTSLNGVVVSFEGVPAGDYTLDAAGSIEVYYEPDVSLQAKLVNQDTGEEVYLNDGSVEAGNYTLEYGLIDNNTEQFSDSPLLGTPTYVATKTTGGVETPIENGETVNFAAQDEEIQLNISATFLDNYHVELGDNGKGFTFNIVPREVGLLSSSLSGGQSEYSLSQLEEGEAFTATFTLDGEPLTDEQLEALQLEMKYDAKSEDSELAFDYNRLQGQSAVEIRARYGNESDPEKACGDYTVWVEASLENEDGAVTNTKSNDFSFSIEDNLAGIAMDLTGPGYLVRSQMEDKGNYTVDLSFDGEPLTEEDFNKLNLNVDFGDADVDYEITPLPEQSAYSVQIHDSDGLKNGSHELTATLTGEDPIGRPVEETSTQKFEVQSYPQWLRWVIIIILILIIALIVWLILNIKVLPKDVSVLCDDCEFKWGTNVIHVLKTSVVAKFNKGKNPTLEISSTVVPKFRIKLDVKAIDPLRISSSKRHVLVTNVRGEPKQKIEKIVIDSYEFVKNDRGVFVNSDDPEQPISFTLQGCFSCELNGKFYNSSTQLDETVNFSGQVEFKKQQS